MSARDDILSAIRAKRLPGVPAPPPYRRPANDGNLLLRFAERARAAAADVTLLDTMDDVPAAVADILRARNLPAAIHTPCDARFDRIAWTVTTDTRAPGPEAAAISFAPHAIAETGTLVYISGMGTPASWHFRAGLEIAIVPAKAILPSLEDVLAKLKQAGALSHTINLVTGPSRTGDIEQTLELGAHGPKGMAILIVRDCEMTYQRHPSIMDV
jgi:L-lactate dehydrogenase complex protein LldG